jgi:glucose-1-phosphate cytidylyltransferase
MKVVILAGGQGTRISEESYAKPKPMVEIGGKPILWHIMKIYSHYGHNDFIVCCGYKGFMIKEYFANYFLHMSDVTINMKTNNVKVHQNSAEPWTITLVDTGEMTMTGGRLKRVKDYVGNEDFCFTYGDGVGDVNITNLIVHHNNQKTLATLTATQPPGRFGALNISENRVRGFHEKPQGDGKWINGGFFVLNPRVIDLIDGDNTTWEQEPMAKLAHDGQLAAYFHQGFWQPMDTLRDKNHLEDLWQKNRAPWKFWT